MHIEQLVTMANDIANFFRNASDPGAGPRNVADHLRRYWAPPMRKQIIAHLNEAWSIGRRSLSGNAAKAQEIELWLDEVAMSYNVLAVDAAIFRRWGQLMHRRADHHLEDALIAATALVRELTVATRNVDDFKPFGVAMVNPFK